MISQNMQIALTAINKWLFFGWNYDSILHQWEAPCGEQRSEVVPVFLVQTKWTCNFDHIYGKWRLAVSSKNSDAYLPRFYAELGKENRIALLEWVMNHYRDEIKLF